MDLAVFYQIIVPLLEMRQAVLIMISTPTGTWSFYNHLFNLVLPSTGEKLFNTVSVELVCPRCLRTERAEHCRHNLHKIPDWKDSDKLDVVKLIYGDRTTTLKRESLGMTADDVNPIIRREFITDLRERPLWVPDYDVVPKFVHIVVDPNAGGDNGFALTALVYLNGQVIVSMMSVVVFMGVRTRRLLRQCRTVLGRVLAPICRLARARRGGPFPPSLALPTVLRVEHFVPRDVPLRPLKIGSRLGNPRGR